MVEPGPEPGPEPAPEPTPEPPPEPSPDVATEPVPDALSDRPINDNAGDAPAGALSAYGCPCQAGSAPIATVTPVWIFVLALALGNRARRRRP